MGSLRSCDGRCHKAKGAACSCWCGGVFHGAGGESAREAFRESFTEIPTDEQSFLEVTGQGSLFGDGQGAGDRWRRAIAAAVDARRAPS